MTSAGLDALQAIRQYWVSTGYIDPNALLDAIALVERDYRAFRTEIGNRDEEYRALIAMVTVGD